MRLPLAPFLLASLSGLAAAQPAVSVRVDASQTIGPVGSLYNVGYDGWGDIGNAGMVRAFQELGVETCRLEVNLRELCGEHLGDYRWDYATARDVGVGFTGRVRRILGNGWRPLLALSLHGAGGALPAWFVGEPSDANGRAWTRYNADGSHGEGQLEEIRAIARDLARHFVEEGLPGLAYETIYEMGHDMPLPEIHHAVALGLREGDPAAYIVGPATWPGWTVEERFVRPFLTAYGPELLDAVSVHWYASNDHDLWKLWEAEPPGFVLTRAHERYLGFILERTTLFGDWVRSLDALLRDPNLNPAGKPIGIVFTEIDVNATSYYLANPTNEDWPLYRADRDCWLNTNGFGGVWWASVLANLASAGVGAGGAKYNTRNYYGLGEMVEGGGVYRYPVWFAMRLLSEHGGLRSGRQVLGSEVAGTPTVEALATDGPDGPCLVLINKAFAPASVSLEIAGLAEGEWEATRYLFDESRCARWLGRKPGEERDGRFEGEPGDDSASALCLEPIEVLALEGPSAARRLPCPDLPPLSFTVLRLAPTRRSRYTLSRAASQLTAQATPGLQLQPQRRH